MTDIGNLKQIKSSSPYLTKLTEAREYILHQLTEDFSNCCLSSSCPLPLKFASVCRTLNGHQLSITQRHLRSYTFLKNMGESHANIMM